MVVKRLIRNRGFCLSPCHLSMALLQPCLPKVVPQKSPKQGPGSGREAYGL